MSTKRSDILKQTCSWICVTFCWTPGTRRVPIKYNVFYKNNQIRKVSSHSYNPWNVLSMLVSDAGEISNRNRFSYSPIFFPNRVLRRSEYWLRCCLSLIATSFQMSPHISFMSHFTKMMQYKQNSWKIVMIGY